jgi:single-stranded-DNA-specific exonuclease
VLVLGQAKIRMATYKLLERQDDDLLKHLLRARGVEEKDELAFLAPDYNTGRHDPFLLHDMEKAVERILLAIKEGEKIAIYSDYDCDGIPGAVILHDFFKAAGYTNFINHIPHRHFDGFGLSSKAVELLATEGVDLIITIDCGTADNAAATRAAALGVDLIITDHHEPKEKLPVATAIVNPRVGDSYPFPYLCGAAVVFKLTEALIARGDFNIKPGQEKWWLDMVALATVGDMMPLIGENRVLVSYGLKVLRQSRRPGLRALLNKARANQRHLTEDDIGFTIAPRINAASRMDAPEDAFLMLSIRDHDAAMDKALHLEKLNNERKGVVAAMTKELKRRVNEMTDMADVLVLGHPDWRPALVGLCANGLSSEYNRPVFLWGRDGNGVIKGSCRSSSAVSVVKLMDAAGHHFLEHGGHHASGGFSVKEDSIFHLGEALNGAFRDLGEAVLANMETPVDAILSLSQINPKLLADLKLLSPFGKEHDKPLFAFTKVIPAKVEQFGKAKEHLKLIFERDFDSIEAIAFFATDTGFSQPPRVGEELTLVAHVEESHFMNRRQTRLRIVDIVPAL